MRYGTMIGVALLAGAAWADTCTWIGTGSCSWSDTGNWLAAKVPAGGYVDDVVFANTAPATITQSGGVWVKNVKVTGADVTLSGSYLKLSEGGVDVAEGVTFTMNQLFQGSDRSFPLVKTGAGTFLVNDQCNTFLGFEARGGLTAFSKGGGDYVKVQPTVTIFDGATVKFDGNNLFENSTKFDVKAGGTLDVNNKGDRIGGVCGEGRVISGATENVPALECTLQNGPYPLGCTFVGAIYLRLDPVNSSDLNARLCISTTNGCRQVYLTPGYGANTVQNPLLYTTFKAGLGEAALGMVQIRTPGEIAAPVDLAGNPVTLVGPTFDVASGAYTAKDFRYRNGIFNARADTVLTIDGGTSSNTIIKTEQATSTLIFKDGTAREPKIRKDAVASTLVLAGGETIDGTWELPGHNVNPDVLIVSGGVHSVNTVLNLFNHKTIRQTGGIVEIKKGGLCHAGNDNCRSALMPFEISGGKFIYHSPSDTGYANQGTGLDASGDAEAWFDSAGGNQRIRIGSDGESHQFRIRDNATIHIRDEVVLMSNGSAGKCATGTVDLVSGTLEMKAAFIQPGNNAAFPTFILFNGGRLLYPSLDVNISNGHDPYHHIYVGEEPARIETRGKMTASFNTPFEPNPANVGTDGGLVKDGGATLCLNKPATIAGPVVVNAGYVQTTGADGTTPMLGTGSITLNGACLYPENKNATIPYATGSGSKLHYKDASFIFLPGTGNGGTYVFGAADATESAFAPVDDASFLVIRNGTQNNGIGTSFKVKVNGEAACDHIGQRVFATMGDASNSVGLYTFLGYDADRGLVPAPMTAFADAGAADYADVTEAVTIVSDKAVRAVRLQKVNLGINTGSTLTVGDGTNPAVILLNSSMLDNAGAAAMPGGGTLAFGGSRGFLIVSCQRNSTYSEVNVKITGSNGVVWGSSPEYRSWFQVGGANAYTGGTWISGTRVTPNASKAFGADRDVYVTGNAGWGGQLSFDSSSVASLDYDLHLAGVGTYFDSQSQGAVRAEKNATLAGMVEFMGDTRLGAIGTGVTLTLAGGVYGTGRLETAGGGRIMLKTANTSWTGGSIVTNGTLVVTVQDALGTGDATVGPGGVLRFENENDITVTNRITGAGRIVLAGAGKVTFTGLDDFAGVVELQDGTLNVDGALAVSELLGTGVITGSGTLYLNADAGAVNGFGGTIKGGVSIVKRGAGVFLLTSRGTYTGSTTVAEGSLKLGWDALAEALYNEAVVRLDATDASTLTVDADGNVSAWRDADGRDVVFTNATTALQPVLRTAQLNGRPAVYFEKGSAHLTADTILGNHTVFLVHRNKSGTRPSGMNAQWNCAGIYGWAGKDKGIRFNGVNYWNWDGWGGNNAAIACNGVDYDPVSRPTPYLTADATTISDVVLPVYQNGELTCLGDYWHDARYGRSYYGDIGELIVFKRVLSAFERKAVRKRLFAKWGVTDPDGLTSVDTLLGQAVAHLDASDVTTLTRDEQDRVLAWRDADGRSLSFTNSLPAECPTYVAGAMDGKGALRFDAVYQHLASTEMYNNHTVFLVHRNKSGNRPADMSSGWGCAGIYGFTGRDCGLRFSSGTAYTTDSSWDNSAYVMRINGVSTPSLTADAVTVAQATLNSAKGGWKTAVGDYWHDMDNDTHTVRKWSHKRSYYGDIGEVVVFARALTEDEAALLTDHLMEKWGLKEPVPPEIPKDGNILPPETALTVASGAVVDLAGVSQTVASLAGAGRVENSGAPLTLSLTGGAGVFSGSFGTGISLRLGADATLTLGGAGAAVENIDGSGCVAGGPLTVTGWIRPGGTNAVGTLTFSSAPVIDGATLEIDIAGGAADRVVVESAFDVSPLTVTVPAFARATELGYEVIHATARSGGILADDFSEKKKWFLSYDGTGVWLKKNAGTILYLR